MCAFMRHVHNHNAPGPISPKIIVSNLRRIGKQFRLGRQEDAHEFMRMLVDGVQTALLKRASVKPSQGRIAETTLIDKVFGGYLRNQLRCSRCGYNSNTYDHCQDISLDVTGSIRSVQQGTQIG
jgi:ubiquitin carboxyl-terminal hydrolase 36/42